MSAAASAASRSRGLDTLRALAIALVFMYHYMVFVSGEPTFGWLSTVGWVGVDLFFVLSGYLIGNQIFGGMVRLSPLALHNFYARRVLRTWPVFWLVLAAYFTFPAEMGGKAPPALWRFLTFTQNWQLQPGTAFSHAWSLCIEEQFYLVLPLVVLIGARLGGRRAHAWLLLATLLCMGVVARGLLWMHFGREADGNGAGYYPNIYYATLCRFDEFLPGLAVALVKNFHPAQWQRLQNAGRWTFAIGLLAVSTVLYGVYAHYYVEGYGYGFFMTTFGYSLVAMAFAMLVASALSPRSPLYHLHFPGAYSLAVWSYSIYLSHKAVAFMLGRQAKAWLLSPSLTLLLITLASLLVGWVLYRAVELPFMQLRDKYFPARAAA